MMIESRRVRILRLGEGSDEVAYNLALALNGVQNYFEFVNDDTTIPVPLLGGRRAAVPVENLQALVLAECKARFPDEYPIGITDRRLKVSYSSAFHTEAAVITTDAKAAAAPNHSLQRYLLYHVVDILMSRFIDLPFHEKTVGCVADYLDDLSDMQPGIAKSDYCPACRRKIIAAISTGQITLQKVAAIFRMLDSAAGRRRCFVLMPFAKVFRDVYIRGVKPAIIGAGWECARADEIFQSRDVMSIVWEEILRSELIVADLTGRNANVYYELGFAHALGKNTILLAQDLKDVPFDLKHRQLVEYSPTRAGQVGLQRAIQHYL